MATALQPQEEWDDERAGKVRIPDRIGDLWVAAEMLVSREDGLLLAAYPMIDQRWSAELAAAQANPPEDCLEMGPGSYAEVPLPRSFSEAVMRADAIVQGVVAGIAGGFYAGLHPRAETPHGRRAERALGGPLHAPRAGIVVNA